MIRFQRILIKNNLKLVYGFCQLLDLKQIKENSHFSNYNQYPKNIDSFRKQLIFRSSNLGMLELDYLIGNWARKYIINMDFKELIQYDEEIMSMETPDLFNAVIQAQSDQNVQQQYQQKVEKSLYLQKLIKYAQSGEAAENIDSMSK